MKCTLVVVVLTLVLLFSVLINSRTESFVKVEDISGEWKKTCTVPMLDGNKLTASCKNNVGTITISSVDLSTCNPGSIKNKKGTLTC